MGSRGRTSARTCGRRRRRRTGRSSARCSAPSGCPGSPTCTAGSGRTHPGGWPTSGAARAGRRIAIAEAYPTVLVDGFDLDEASIAVARANAAEHGVADRVRFDVRDITDPGLTGRYDLVAGFEMLHDLARPVEALAAMRRLLADGGSVLIVDERVAETLHRARRRAGAVVLRLQHPLLPAHRNGRPALGRHRDGDASGHAALLRTRGRLRRRDGPADRTRPVPLLPPSALTDSVSQLPGLLEPPPEERRRRPSPNRPAARRSWPDAGLSQGGGELPAFPQWASARARSAQSARLLDLSPRAAPWRRR